MKKRTPDDLKVFDYEDNFIHAISEGNSRYIAQFGQYMTVPASPAGKEKPKFKVGDLVANTERSTFKAGMCWKVLEVYKENGFMRYQSQLVLTPEQIKKKWPATKTTFLSREVIAWAG